MCDRGTFDLLMKMRSRSDLLRFGEIAPCFTGELDMTQGKKYLTDNGSKPMLVKGVQIARYVFKTTNEEISQGKIEFVDTEEFFKKCSAEKQEQIKGRGRWSSSSRRTGASFQSRSSRQTARRFPSTRRSECMAFRMGTSSSRGMSACPGTR